MNVTLIESFDYYDTPGLAERYDVVAGNLGAGGVVAGKGRRGSRGFWAPTNQGGSLTKYIREVEDFALYAGAAVYAPQNTSFDVSAGPTLFHFIAMNHFGEVGSMLHTTITPDGRISVDLYGGIDQVQLALSPPGVIRYGQGWQYVEFCATVAINPLTQRFDLLQYAVSVDGDLVIEYIHPVGIPTDLVRPWSGVTYRAPGGVQLDDLYAGDGPYAAGGGRFLGDASAFLLPPDGAGDVTEWAPDAASLAAGLANWQTVEEHPPDDADYVSADVTGTRDRYAFEDTALPADTEVFAVAVNLRALKLDTGPRTVGPSVKSGGVVEEWRTFPVGDVPHVYQSVWAFDPVDPDQTTAWTVAAVNALLAGPRLHP